MLILNFHINYSASLIRSILVTSPSESRAEMFQELSGFPTLKPALITKMNIGDVHDLGKSYE